MLTYLEIKSIHAREILDSRGNPTVEAQTVVKNPIDGRLLQQKFYHIAAFPKFYLSH